MAFEFFDPSSVSLKTSKDTLVSDFEKSLKNWEASVTKRRGEYSQRLKLAHLTNESGSSSWPTSSTRDYKGGYVGGRIRNGKISMDTLDVAVQAVESGLVAPANWPTIQARDYRSVTGNEMSQRDNAMQNLNVAVTVHGLVAPANPSTAGSRLESWATPNGLTGRGASKTQGRDLLMDVKQWATPKASDPQHSGPNMRDSAGNYALPAQAVRASWETPTVSTGGHRQADGSMTPKLDQQVKHYKQLNVEVEAKATGKLNPRWVETLMGLPVGWTMPSCASPVTIEPTNSDFSATESSPPPQP